MSGRSWTRREFVERAALAAVGVRGARLLGQGSGTVAEVRTPLGSLRGESLGGVRVFRGVPFAEPPVGDLRFRAPVAKRAWTGVREATKFGAAAMQFGDRDVAQSEDCLYLNVWAPEAGGAVGRGPWPVFVWIHGGGFTGGESFAAVFDGAEFARQGMVVVTVAYRLGVMGFLDVEPLLGAEYAGSGNNALRDLMMALEWVKANVGAFGGDATRVTIGGESAGAKLTDILMGVPAAAPLFGSMISESGGAERIWPKAAAQVVAEGFGKRWAASANGRTAAGVKTAAVRDLIDVQQEFIQAWPQHFPLRCEVDGGLITRLPIEGIRDGLAKGKRLLIGTNRDESAAFAGPHPQHDATAADLGNAQLAAFAKVYAEYATLYPGMSEEMRRIRALTAEEYWVPSVRVADAHVKAGGRAWMYELEFARSGGRYKGESYHALDLSLVWDKPSGEFESAGAEAALAKQMNAAWVAFAKGGAPAAEGLPDWPEYNVQTRPTMVLDVVSRVEEKPQEKELRLWDGVL
jgi:para-nitrobenzyl esterase